MFFLQKSFRVSLIFLVLGFVIVNFSYANPIKKIFNEATLAFGRGDFKRAEKLYLETLKIFPQFAPSYYYLALVSNARGDSSDSSIKYLKKAIEFDPNYSEAYDYLGKSYYSLGRFDEAEENFLRAIEIKPQLVSARLSVAWIYLLVQSAPDKAITQFEEVLKVSALAPAYFGLGLSYFKHGERIKIFDMVTQLKFMGETSLAGQLETMVREGRYIPPQMIHVPVAASKRTKPTIVKDFPVLDSSSENIKIRLREKKLKPTISSSVFSNQSYQTGEQRILDMQNKNMRKGSGY